MKKLLTILGITILVWGCAKKMTPAKSETPASNTGASAMGNNGTVTTSGNSSNTGNVNSPAQTGVAGETGTKSRPPVSLDPAEASRIAGQATYNVKCGRCHGLKVTTDYTDLRWVQIMAVMSRNANLTEEERTNVLAYVRANAKK